mmetsp:Transcript_37376/g.86232  ORF Transcript_37376/g.86232 Transcript_37376/m.86232 type:complete len:87 (+) Transcript_37376:1276-1536(+)
MVRGAWMEKAAWQGKEAKAAWKAREAQCKRVGCHRAKAVSKARAVGVEHLLAGDCAGLPEVARTQTTMPTTKNTKRRRAEEGRIHA